MAELPCRIMLRHPLALLGLLAVLLPQVAEAQRKTEDHVITEEDPAAQYAPGHRHDMNSFSQDAEHPYNADLPPVIIIPPLTGSVLKADTDGSAKARCSVPVPSQLWPLSKGTMLAAVMGCWQDQFRIEVDAKETVKSGIEVTAEPLGVHVHTTAYGDWQKANGPGTWEAVVAQLHILGYREDKNLFLAPFDWRHGPGNWKEEAWPLLKAAIEGWTDSVAKGPAIFISVSMGCPYFVAFLLHSGVDAAWKKKYVAGFVSMSGPFAGSAGALGAVLWGNPNPVRKSSAEAGAPETWTRLGAAKSIEDLVSGFGSILWLTPRHRSDLARPPLQLVQLPSAWHGNVTDEGLADFLSAKDESAAALYRLAHHFPTLAHPGVFTVCMYGTKVPTASLFGYGESPVPVAPVESTAKGKASAIADMAMGMAEGKLKEKGVKFDGDKAHTMAGKLMKFAESKFGEADLAPTPPTPLQVPSGPPTGTKPGDKAWLASAVSLVKSALPDRVVKVPGDGLVENESLNVCDDWRGVEGMPDVEVRRFPGYNHAREVRDSTGLLYLRNVVARLAGVANPNTTETPFAMSSSSTCAELQPGGKVCKDTEHSDVCSLRATQGDLEANDKCCIQGGELIRCMGNNCFKELLVSQAIIAQEGNPGEFAPVLRAWASSCTAAHFPPLGEVMKEAEALRRKFKKERGEKTGAAGPDGTNGQPASACLSKVPGFGCPVVRDIKACNAKAAMLQFPKIQLEDPRKDTLNPQDSCCINMREVQSCMGSVCFAGFVASALVADPAVGSQILKGWTNGCTNVQFPSKETLESVLEKSAGLTVAAAMAKKVAEELAHQPLDLEKLHLDPKSAKEFLSGAKALKDRLQEGEKKATEGNDQSQDNDKDDDNGNDNDHDDDDDDKKGVVKRGNKIDDDDDADDYGDGDGEDGDGEDGAGEDGDGEDGDGEDGDGGDGEERHRATGPFAALQSTIGHVGSLILAMLALVILLLLLLLVVAGSARRRKFLLNVARTVQGKSRVQQSADTAMSTLSTDPEDALLCDEAYQVLPSPRK